MTPFVFVLAALVAYRVSLFITADTFPPMTKLRFRISQGFRKSKLVGVVNPTWADFITCIHCVGIYVTAAIVLVLDVLLEYSVPLPFFVWLALAGSVSLVAKVTDK